MRVTSQIWVDALLRRVFAEGSYASVVKRGATEAGAIFIVVNHLDGHFTLFGPAPQAIFAESETADRLFAPLICREHEQEVLSRLDKEKKFDFDLWTIEIEHRGDQSFFGFVDS